MLTSGFFSQYILPIPILVWVVAQGIKILLYSRYRSVGGILAMFKSGGMPSAHTAFLSSLTTAIGMKDGFFSTTFTLALSLTAIVAYDAMHVRYESGKHAKFLNSLTKGMSLSKQDSALLPLETSIGHTFGQVVCGGLLGTYLGYTLYML